MIKSTAMPIFRFFSCTLLLFFTVVVSANDANEPNGLRLGSYQELVAQHEAKPLVVVFWSISCASCLKEMATIKEIHQEQPSLPIVMVSIDDSTEASAVLATLQDKGLSDLESWVFTESNPQRLRYEIDSTWYGEIPRLYFFDADHNRRGISGKISKADWLELLAS
jgi:thiol-disulfide isomerase/thioredoxin